MSLDENAILKDYVENKGCKLELETTGALDFVEKYSVTLRTAHKKHIHTSHSKVSVDKCLASIEKVLREKQNEEFDDNHPFKILKNRLNEINLFHTRTYGKDKIGGFRIGLNYGVDESNELTQVPMYIGIGNAGNNIIEFDALQDSAWIDVNASWSNNHLTSYEQMMKVIELVGNYLYEDKKVRLNELTGMMKSSRDWEKRAYKK